MIHGVRSERKTLLIPYITFTSITVLTGCIKVRVKALLVNFNISSYLRILHILATWQF